MDEKLLVRISAVVFVTLAIIASAVELTRRPADEPTLLQPLGGEVNDATLRDELLRCQLMGNLPMPPKECLDAWSESRRRFLGGDPSASLPVKTLPQTGSSATDSSSPSNTPATSQGTAPATSVSNPSASTDAAQQGSR